MELENKVPVDINKRKTIARLLHIPPMLFGLATLEEMTLEPQPQGQQATTGQTRLARVPLDTARYQSNVRTFWQLHDTGNALDKLDQLQEDIHDLERLEQQTKGDLLSHLQETLFACHILATHIIRDQRDFRLAYEHANQAVRVAKNMKDSDLIATALFTRGWSLLEWGLYSTMKRGIFQVQDTLVQKALDSFEEAKKLFPGKENMHPQLLGPLSMMMYRAQAILVARRGERLSASILVSMDDVADTVARQVVDDLYTRILIRGQRKSWHYGGYHSIRSVIFNVAGLPGQALKELNDLKRESRKTYNRDETRQFTWLDILKANTYMELEEFGVATDYARRALLSCQDISSITNIAIITDIYARLLQSPYKKSPAVKELGDILRKSSIDFLS